MDQMTMKRGRFGFVRFSLTINVVSSSNRKLLSVNEL